MNTYHVRIVQPDSPSETVSPLMAAHWDVGLFSNVSCQCAQTGTAKTTGKSLILQQMFLYRETKAENSI